MAKLQQAFDPSEVPEDEGGDFGLLPVGNYQARIVGSDEYENKKKNGRIIELQWQVDGPTHAGRRLWQRLNYIHENPKAQLIASQDLKAITDACKKPHGISSTEELHGIPMMIRVKVKSEPGYEDKNEVGRAKPLKNAKPAKAKPKTTKAQAKADVSDEAGGVEPDEDDDEIPF